MTGLLRHDSRSENGRASCLTLAIFLSIFGRFALKCFRRIASDFALDCRELVFKMKIRSFFFYHSR